MHLDASLQYRCANDLVQRTEGETRRNILDFVDTGRLQICSARVAQPWQLANTVARLGQTVGAVRRSTGKERVRCNACQSRRRALRIG